METDLVDTISQEEKEIIIFCFCGELSNKHFQQGIDSLYFHISEHSKDRLELKFRLKNYGFDEGYVFFKSDDYAGEFRELMLSVEKKAGSQKEYSTKGFVDLDKEIGGFYWKISPQD